MTQYFTFQDNEQKGPFSFSELASQNIKPDTLIWYDGLADWQKADTLPELAALLPGSQQAKTTSGDYPQGDETQSRNLYPENWDTGVQYWNYASFGDRFLAAIIDTLIVSVVGGLLSGILVGGLFATGLNPALAGVGNVGFSIILNAVYFAYMESSAKRATFGKAAMGLKVVDANQERITFINALGRYFAKVISGMILFIGYLMMLWDDRSQTLHDKLASTYVLKK
jgi:uncharacterized RDD family membrane protein YckC